MDANKFLIPLTYKLVHYTQVPTAIHFIEIHFPWHVLMTRSIFVLRCMSIIVHVHSKHFLKMCVKRFNSKSKLSVRQNKNKTSCQMSGLQNKTNTKVWWNCYYTGMLLFWRLDTPNLPVCCRADRESCCCLEICIVEYALPSVQYNRQFLVAAIW